jgi:hypothetical protein
LVKKSHPIKQPIRITQNFKMKTKNFKIILTILFILFAIKNGFSQTNNKDVTITSSGSGKTLEDAKQAALRSATEQAFGAFISSKTEMFNDQVVADQMSSVSSGNIKSYEVLNESQLPDMRYGVTLKTIVSIDKLTSFVQAKGVYVEIKGGMFAINIKQQILNEQAELKIVKELFGLMHEYLQTSLDYDIKSGDPKSLDSDSKNWGILLKVTAKANQNMDFCANYFIKTIASMGLTTMELENYKSLDKTVFPVVFNYKGITKKIYLRNENSVVVLNRLLVNWKFYTKSFFVSPEINNSIYINNEPLQIHEFGNINNYTTEGIKFNFLTKDQVGAIYSWQDNRTLSQLEQMTGYIVKPIEPRYQFKHGGYVVYEKNGSGLIAAPMSSGRLEYYDAKSYCQELQIDGYSDWRLPNYDELILIYNNLFQNGISNWGPSNEYDGFAHWSSTNDNSRECSPWMLFFKIGKKYYTCSSMSGPPSGLVRAVRSFGINKLPKRTSLAVTTAQLAIFTRISDNSTIYINANESLEIFSLNPDEDTWKAKYNNIEGTIKSIYLNKTSEYLAFENIFLVN